MATIKLSYPTSYKSISAGYPNYSSGRYHGGVDFPCPTGTDVRAAADGKIIIRKELNYSYGHYLKIQHANGFATLYAHNSKLLVSLGQEVKQGQLIAKSGSTGNSTGPHCHFEVWKDGNRVNPLNYLDKTITIDSSNDTYYDDKRDDQSSWIDTLYEEVILENYSGEGYSKVGSGIHNVYRLPNLKVSRFTTVNNEKFQYLGKVKGKNIYYIRMNKGGNSEGYGFLSSSQCGGSPKRTSGTQTLKILKDNLNLDDLQKLGISS